MFPYQGLGNSANCRLVSHMSSPRISMSEMPHAALVNNSVECHPIRQQQRREQGEKEAAGLKRKQKRLRRTHSFPHWGHLSERNVTTASPPQWARHTLRASRLLSHAQTLHVPGDCAAAATLALRAPRKRVTEGEFQHM